MAIGDKAMTPAERQQRRRDKLKAALPPRNGERRFRLELWRWVKAYRQMHPSLTDKSVERSLGCLETAMRMMEHFKTAPTFWRPKADTTNLRPCIDSFYEHHVPTDEERVQQSHEELCHYLSGWWESALGKPID